MVASFASPQDMEDRSQGAITATSHPFLQKELDAATVAIQNACGWHIAPQQACTYTRVSRIPSLVFLPAQKIASVESVNANGEDMDPALFEFDGDTGETNLYSRAVVVKFTAGYEEVPADLVLLCLELAAGGLGASNILREQSGGVGVTYARTSSSLLPEDRPRIAQYRLQPIP